MVCGGFTCSKNTLAALNVLYIIVAIILITVAAYGRVVAVVTSLTLVGSIIACGVFLFIIALVGLIGAIKHHQVLLFFYMIILFLLFLLQFSLACALLAVNPEQKENLFRKGWSYASQDLRSEVQKQFNCCGLEQKYQIDFNTSSPTSHPICGDAPKNPKASACCVNAKAGGSTSACCTGSSLNATDPCPCTSCLDTMKPLMFSAFTCTGGVGLFFSFTEIVGVWLAMRYRNQKDPRANPSAFL